MTWFDYAVLAVMGLSILISVIRGMFREVLALISWIAAFAAANYGAAEMARLLPASVPGSHLRVMVGFIIILLAVFLMMKMITIAVCSLVKMSGLTVPDRLLGMVFGAVRGFCIVMIGVLLAGMTAMPKEPFWRNAKLSPFCEAAATKMIPWLPQSVASQISF